MKKLKITQETLDNMASGWNGDSCPNCHSDEAYEVDTPDRESDYASTSVLTREMHCNVCGFDFAIEFEAVRLVVGDHSAQI